jgi:hypothetical protein
MYKFSRSLNIIMKSRERSKINYQEEQYWYSLKIMNNLQNSKDLSIFKCTEISRCIWQRKLHILKRTILLRMLPTSNKLLYWQVHLEEEQILFLEMRLLFKIEAFMSSKHIHPSKNLKKLKSRVELLVKEIRDHILW